jgi:hypothetical protein
MKLYSRSEMGHCTVNYETLNIFHKRHSGIRNLIAGKHQWCLA